MFGPHDLPGQPRVRGLLRKQMVKDTNPGLLDRANKTEAPHADIHGLQDDRRHHARLQPLRREIYKGGAAHEPRHARDVLPHGGPPRSSVDALSGGVGTVATPQLFTDYLTRALALPRLREKAVPLTTDVFDFFLEALPGYDQVASGGRPRLLGLVEQPDHVDYDLRNMERLGEEMFVTPGVIVDGRSVTTNLVTSTSASASCSAAPTR